MNTLEMRTRLYAAFGDRYHIERTLGEGGLSTVYLARDLKHGRDVAVKVLKSEVGAAVGPERFNREMEIAATLSHPNILPTFDWGDAGGTLFCVMPSLRGHTLRDVIDSARQLSIEEAIRICGEIAGALDYAHRRGVLHRDVKPQNVILEDGRLLIADFGIGSAMATIEGGALAKASIGIGTPAYMSPEQVAGEPVDARSDVYSLASLLYEMLVGEPPFVGPVTQVVISKRFMQTPPSVMVMRDGIHRPVACALQSALARSPADRPLSAGGFVASLIEAEHESVPAAREATFARN
jgi:eukaryotic-like serine/threonine-protein kinase